MSVPARQDTQSIGQRLNAWADLVGTSVNFIADEEMRDEALAEEQLLREAVERLHALELATSSLLATWNNWRGDLPPDHTVAVGIARLRAVVLEGAAGNEQADAGAPASQARGTEQESQRRREIDWTNQPGESPT